MKHKGLYVLVFTIISLMLSLPESSHAGCTKWCNGRAYAYMTIKMKNDRIIKRHTELSLYQTEGRYGGGCKTHVGREKARKRACNAAKEMALREYKGKSMAQQSKICSKVTERGSLHTYIESKYSKTDYVQMNEVDWIKINYIKVTFEVENGSKEKACKSFTFKEGCGQQFRCVNNRPVSAQPAPPRVMHRPEHNTNRNGSDYRNFPLNEPDYKFCMKACLNDRECKAWTYVKPGVQGRKAHCWLKNAVPRPQRDTNCISGVK